MSTSFAPSRPVGRVVDARPATQPAPTTLTGRFITLEPLSPSHASALYSVICGAAHASLWDYMFDGPFKTPADFDAFITSKSSSRDPLFFALLDPTTTPVGYASLMRIDIPNRVVEIGHVMFSPALQRTRAATEALFMLVRHALEDLGFRRCEWKCDTLNAPSRRAAARMGFLEEGVFRQHMIVKGRSRDTAWFGMLDGEWPRAREGFERWLDDGNFDEEGRQRRRLEDCREKM
ncbi:acetyltransferase, GNAT family [Blyttiomyces helicus]|uniref:Acetyltransferase, GNAT family n=1 Tax=Blyttiomyces helicus TaxID=388810 RepID=A0A4P9WD47_9FUNG|nr:acetyltransferase, GNAT family [Blyttiomyces helicus]|eukprot:RKO89615.1 acetyltransferase, GNAT family [Blyttiomyces helicus]